LDEKKLANYEYTVYILEETMKCELVDLKLNDDWLKNPSSAFKRGKLNSIKETLYFLTLDNKWLKPLEDLQIELKD
jgi:hypothetical protein